MHHSTFKPLAEPTYGVMRKAALLTALDRWKDNPKPVFSTLAPPVDALPDGVSDENAVLAAIFYRLTRAENLTAQITLIQLELFHHNRLYQMAWGDAEGEADPRRRPRRSSYVELKPYEHMIHRLEDWAEALHQRACE
jgi:hypothetical protein